MIDFNKLRASKGTNLAAQQKILERTESSGFKKDERIWKPTKKEGKSENIIRFLPIAAVDMAGVEAGTYKAEDLTPLAKILKNYFQGPKGWYVENSPQTFGEPDPVREHDTPLWADWAKAGKPDDDRKKLLVRRIASPEYYVNILVIKDVNAPENNGKQFLYQPPETIKKMIDKAGVPEFETDPKFDPYDAWEGRNLYLNLTYVKKVISGKEVDAPDFKGVKWADAASPMGKDDAEIEKIWNAEYSLMEFYDRKNFKSYDELKTKFCKVMGIDENFNPIAGGQVPANAEQLVNTKESAPAKEATASTATDIVAASTAVKEEKAAETKDDPSSSLSEFERMLAAGGNG